MVSIIYPNLAAEMTRYNVMPKDIADGFGIHINGVYLMLKGKREMSIERAKALRDLFFPGMQIDYLFATDPEGIDKSNSA